MSAITPAQEQAAGDAYRLLSEHFSGVVIITLAECGENVAQEAVAFSYYGGRLQALGMLEEAKAKLLIKESDELQ